MSGTVYDQIETKLPLTYDYLGEQTVKNIAKPVRVWRGVIDDAAGGVAATTGLTPHDSPQEGHAPQRPVRAASRTWVVVVIAGLVLLVGGSVTVRYFIRPPLN